VASGGYATATGLDDDRDDANIVLEMSGAQASSWHFVLTARDEFWDPHEEHFAIVTGAAPRLASLDHYGQRRVLASAERFWPSDNHHMWKAVPRDGAFTFLNVASGRLLCLSRTAGVDTAPPTANNNPACLWRLVDPRTGEPCKVLYDATANVVPPEIAGFSAETLEAQARTVPPRMLLRTQRAPTEVAENFAQSLKVEHELVRGMLESEYAAIVLGPQLVIGWKGGRILKIHLQDEDSMLGMPKFKGKEDFDPCPSLT